MESTSVSGNKYTLVRTLLEEDEGKSVAGEYIIKATNTQGDSQAKVRLLVAQNPPSFIKGLDKSQG